MYTAVERYIIVDRGYREAVVGFGRDTHLVGLQ